MTTEVQSTENTTPTPTAKTLSSPDLSFAEYETLRRGGTVTVETTSTPSAPTEANPQKEQKQSAASDTATTETTESEHEETETDTDPSSGEGEVSASDKQGKNKGLNKRFSKITKQRAEAEAKAAALAQENEILKQRLALRGAGDAEKPETGQTKPTQATTGKPNPDDFNTHAEWVEAVADWKAEQKLEAKLKERDAKSERDRLASEQAKVASTYAERLKEFTAKTPDFDEVEANVTEALDEIGMKTSPALGSIFLHKANGPELAYELAKDPKEYIRVNKLPPLEAAIEIGKLEARIAARTSVNQVTEKKTTSAPKPIEPVGGGKAPGGKKSPEEMTFSEYEKYRREQMKRRA